jgi:hypothetical protein
MSVTDGGSPPAFDEAQAREARHVERDTPMTATYVYVLIVEAVIVVALWFFGRLFS